MIPHQQLVQTIKPVDVDATHSLTFTVSLATFNHVTPLTCNIA
jgi:hypothetical protein